MGRSAPFRGPRDPGDSSQKPRPPRGGRVFVGRRPVDGRETLAPDGLCLTSAKRPRPASGYGASEDGPDELGQTAVGLLHFPADELVELDPDEQDDRADVEV